ncbi:hypothetical protein SAMN04487965_0472 [Microbulbifer donghaiensis]|uniref:Uncharacterized protein n=1 Tax=Microbulbifer donghaiensis TaxID=494016 RepID=A0A1M4VNL3_9GAMM|nr:hypothetical protein [Microbulbifer donghaiensis]SHE70437.1 hypothetical protein SAMN04487965_0472 [Microbulbifer donghaiensis]
MSGQEKFQVVSAGKTLRARAPEAVVQDAAKAFSIPLSQARRLLVKGWVIKDQLSSKQVLEYRSRLQKIGLRVDVFPAGQFDNRALIAKMQFAQQRRARNEGATTSAPVSTEVGREVVAHLPAQTREAATAAVTAEVAEAASTRKGGARAQVESLFNDVTPTVKSSSVERAQLVAGIFAGALVPALFVILLGLCGYSVLRAVWQLVQAIVSGEFGAFTAIGSLLSVLLAAFVAALLVLPFFAARRLVPQDPDVIPLQPTDAKGLSLLLQVLADKTGLPEVRQVSVAAGVDVVVEPTLADVCSQQLPLRIGLSAVRSLNGNELLALVARACGAYRGKLGGVSAWLVLDTARRIQHMQWALENDRSIVSPSGEASALRRPLHLMLSSCGKAVLPLLDRLYGLHRALTATVARRLERRGDAWAAQLLGSREFTVFAEKWHQLVHAELLVAEINREAAVAGQHLQNYPAAVLWMFSNLDDETRSNIELAMAQESDAWDSAQAADNERIGWAEELALQPLLSREFAVQKLFEDLAELERSVSAGIAAEGTRPAENQRLLCVSKEAEQALQILAEYFNQLPPRRFLPLKAPASEELQAMDLQETINWLRGRLVELRELEQRYDTLRTRGAAMQLGAALIRIQSDIQPQEFFLSGTTPSMADESVRDNRVRRQEMGQQIQQIFGVFNLRLRRALELMPAGERQAAAQILQQLSAYQALAPHLDRLENYADMLGLMIDRLSLEPAQRDLVQKYFALAVRELESLFSVVDASDDLRRLGLGAALEQRVELAPAPKLPDKRPALVDTLQTLELKCKNASAAIAEHYRVLLCRLLQPCLKQERKLKVKPLRLLGAV